MRSSSSSSLRCRSIRLRRRGTGSGSSSRRQSGGDGGGGGGEVLQQQQRHEDRTADTTERTSILAYVIATHITAFERPAPRHVSPGARHAGKDLGQACICKRNRMTSLMRRLLQPR